MQKRLLLAAFAAVILIVLLLASAGPQERTVRIRVSGAWALYPLMVNWSQEYERLNPAVKVEVSAGGAGKGMADTIAGLVDIGMVSRDVDPSEFSQGAYPIAVAKDAVVATMNWRNPLIQEILSRGLTRQKLQQIFVNGTLTDWGIAAGKPDKSSGISVYVRSDSCGAGEIWGKYLGVKQDGLVGIGVNADPGIAEAVSKDVRGIGYNNLNFAYDPSTGEPLDGIAILPIDLDEDGEISQDESFYKTKDDMVGAIADGRYPSPPSRELYLVTMGKPYGPEAEFMRWILTGGQGSVLPSGYIPLPEERLQSELEKLN